MPANHRAGRILRDQYFRQIRTRDLNKIPGARLQSLEKCGNRRPGSDAERVVRVQPAEVRDATLGRDAVHHHGGELDLLDARDQLALLGFSNEVGLVDEPFRWKLTLRPSRQFSTAR